MLIALAGRAAGYDGNFDFSKIGKYVFEGDIVKRKIDGRRGYIY